MSLYNYSIYMHLIYSIIDKNIQFRDFIACFMATKAGWVIFYINQGCRSMSTKVSGGYVINPLALLQKNNVKAVARPIPVNDTLDLMFKQVRRIG